MEITTYQKEAARTCARIDNGIIDDMYMVLGMQTEVAEIADVYIKHITYGKELDLINIKEDIGDTIWYFANICNMHGWDLRDIMQTNIDKLKSRYPDKFDSEKAINRDLEAERAILEKPLFNNKPFTVTEIEKLQSKVYEIVGEGEVMGLFNELLGINAG